MPAPEIICQLVERFEQNREAYRSGKYNETQLRREFLDSFFEALGWDVNNRQGYAEAYKDVVHEDSLEVEGATKAPDYAFRIGGTRKFFVEAKKPAVNIQYDIHPAFQLRRYAWSAKLPLSILTDFEEFAVYDCRSKPDKNDTAATGRVMFLTFKDYAEKWDDLAAIFSRDAVLKGSFDKYAETARGKKGTAEVDDAFLAEIERWRDLLARNIALRNPDLSVRELNFAVQMTIDRIIFLRICEDRGVERYGQLLELMTPNPPLSPHFKVQKWGEARGVRGSILVSASCSARPIPATTPACSTSPMKRDNPARRMRSPLACKWTTRRSRIFCATCIIPTARMSFRKFLPTFWARCTNVSWARSSA
ncbi:MAG: type I restriction enzyme HsdR N-terminal domain-containing protein [Anaerolineales bacterium]|nr:type I restriction enzyme HsdR N-terminal domain-containing protein [Anaerolineales bacterium]